MYIIWRERERERVLFKEYEIDVIANEATVHFVMSLYLAAAILQDIRTKGKEKEKKHKKVEQTLGRLAHSNVEVSRQSVDT